MHFGMPTLIEYRSLEENIEACDSLGLKFLELNMNLPEYQIDKLENTDKFIDAARRRGIYYTIHLDENLDIADFNPIVSKAYFETVRRTIEVAKKLLVLRNEFGNVKNPLTVNMHLNHGIHITLPDKKVQMYERDFERYLSAYIMFRKQCEKWIGDSDIVITVENTDGYRDYEKLAISELLKSRCFALTWDIGHSWAVGEKDAEFIKNNISKLIHFHIHDATSPSAYEKKAGTNHLVLGDGNLNVEERLNLAVKAGARCVIETKTKEALEKSVKWLSQHEYLSLLSTTQNTRDIGGYMTESGKTTAADTFIRSDRIGYPTDSDIECLLNNNITISIDMRTEKDVMNKPSGLYGRTGITYYNFPVEEGSGIPASVEEVPQSYLRIAESDSMYDIFKCMANAESGVIYNCSAGKDRTGVVTAILMLHAGVVVPQIIQNYLLTRELIEDRLDFIHRNMPNLNMEIITPCEWYMTEFIRLFKNRYGSTNGYFKSIGLSMEEAERLRKKMLKTVE